MFGARVLCVVVLAGFVLGLGSGPAQAWQIQTVDSGGNVGYCPSLKLDGSGYPRISYYDATNADLKYAAWNGLSWAIETVDADPAGSLSVGVAPSLALDSSGYPRISYGYEDPHPTWSLNSLKYAAWNGSSWDLQMAFSGSNTGGQKSLALDSSDVPHIAHYRCWPYGNDLLYTSWNGSSWSSQTVDDGYEGVVGSSLALDGSDNPHISYYDWDDHGLRYAVWNGSSWVSQLLDTAPRISGIAYDTSLVVDGSGNAHISYLIGDGHLKYAAWDGSNWHIETVDGATTVNLCTALALDASGHPHIVYYDDTNQVVKYAAWIPSTSSWDIETVDWVGTYMYDKISLALDDYGFAHISYYDSTNGDLKYANNIPEPATLSLLGLGGLMLLRRRKSR